MRRFTTVDALLVMLVLIWGGNFTVVKAVMREFEPMAFNAIRFSLASVLMAALLWWWERDIKIERSDIPRFFPLALIGNVVYQILFIAGIEKTRAGDATLILAVTPVVTLLLSILFRTEKIHPYSFLGVILSFLGVLLVVYESGGLVTEHAMNPLLGDLMIFGCVVCWSVYTVRAVPFLKRYGFLKFTTHTMLIGSVFILPLGIPALVQQDWSRVTWKIWAGLGFSAVGALVFCYAVWYYAVQKIGNAQTSVYANLVAPVGLLFAWMFLGERVGPGHLLGLGVILVGIYLTRKAPHPDTPETGT